MEQQFDASKIAALTGNALQDDETFKSEGGFVPERDQVYFEMRQGGNTFYVGVRDLLICLKLLESMNEIPEIGGKWWSLTASLYGDDLPMIESKKEE